MNWSIRLALLSYVVFSTQIIFGAEQVATPWESTQMTESFIASFVRAIGRSSAFSSSQLDDMSTLRKTLTEAMETFYSSNMSSKTKHQALNMVFASAIAEIAAADYGGVSIESKTKEIENALNSASQETTGTKNTQFVGDIKNLILTLAHTKTTGVSTASAVKVGDYKQGSLEQLEPSTSATVMSVSSSAPQRGLEIEQQGLLVVQPSKGLGTTGGYGPPLPSFGRLQGPPFQTPTKQNARGSKIASSVVNSQSLSGLGPQRSSSQVPSDQDQLGAGGYGTGVAIAGASGGGLGPSVQSLPTPTTNGFGQQSPFDYDQIGEDSSSQGKFGVAGQGPGGNGLTAIGSYGKGSVTSGLQGPPRIKVKGPVTQEPSKTGGQGPGDYEVRAQASATMDEKELGGGATGPLVKGSSAYREQEQGVQGISVAEDQRPKVYEPGNYGYAAISDGVTSFRPSTSTGQPQESQEPSGKDIEGSISYGSRADATVVTGSYVASTGTGRVQKEVQDVQGSSRTGNLDEKRIRVQIPSGQRPVNQVQYGNRYQETGRFGGQGLGNYIPGADATPEAEGISVGQAPTGQRSSEVGGQGPGSLIQYGAESRSANYGLNDYDRSSAAVVATAASDSKLRNGVKGLQGLSSNGPAPEGHNGYASGRTTAIARPVGGNGPFGPLISTRISNPEDSSKVSSTPSFIVSSDPTRTSALSNAVSSIVSQVGTINPDLSYCNVHIQTMLEIVADLVHLLGYCN